MPANPTPAPTPPLAPDMARVVERNIAELLKRQQAEDQRKTWQD